MTSIIDSTVLSLAMRHGERERGVTVETGAWVREFGRKWRHDIVRLNGREIGRIQVRRIFRRGRMPERVECLTLAPDGACVMGSNVDWLARRAG